MSGKRVRQEARLRGFARTKGGEGEEQRETPALRDPEARRDELHYDFRLEVDGVLESWAVPKGPSTDPREKRLAMPTEDHPLEYRDFEGVIPEGQYGAGAVIVWDAGTYHNLRERTRGVPMCECLADGQVEVFLHGKKLRGGYALVRTGSGGGRPRWLLVKMKDEDADARRNPVSTEPQSVKSGRTTEELAREARDEG